MVIQNKLFRVGRSTWPSVESFLKEWIACLNRYSSRKRRSRSVALDWSPAYQQFCETHRLSTKQLVEALQANFYGKAPHRRLWIRARAAWWARRNYARKKRLKRTPRLRQKPR